LISEERTGSDTGQKHLFVGMGSQGLWLRFFKQIQKQLS
jgi:hypothetical protein